MNVQQLKPAVLTIRRADLVRHDACEQWLEAFDAVCQERDLDRATGACMERGPLVRRRDGSVYRDATRLRIVLTPLAQVWLALPLGDGGSAWAWLRARGVVGAVSAPRADLSRANLSRADLSGADLSCADLSGADLSGANLYRADLGWANLSGANLSGANLSWADLSWADLGWANLSGANLSGADLTGADLTGADLTGADRLASDPAVDGWRVANGRMERAS